MHKIGTVETHTSPDDLGKEWSQLEGACRISGYQTQRWVCPWLHTVGSPLGLKPLFILARDLSGAPAAMFALALAAKASLRVASYAGGKDSNINLPLVRPDVLFEEVTIRRVLSEGALSAGVDAFALYNQPVEWRGEAHPLSALPHQAAPSLLHGGRLHGDGAAFMSRISGDSRKRFRWRLRKLEEIGPVRFIQARAPEEIATVASAFRRQKKARLNAMGAAAGFDSDLAAAFIENAALGSPPGIELHALFAGDRVVGTYAGVVHGNCYHAMLNSYDAAPEIARISPGDVVTVHLLQTLSDRGIAQFDLGVGEAAYKDKWCDSHVPLFDTIIGVTAKGKAYALAQSAKQRVKRKIKQSERLWPIALKLRARLAGET